MFSFCQSCPAASINLFLDTLFPILDKRIRLQKYAHIMLYMYVPVICGVVLGNSAAGNIIIAKYICAITYVPFGVVPGHSAAGNIIIAKYIMCYYVCTIWSCSWTFCNRYSKYT